MDTSRGDMLDIPLISFITPFGMLLAQPCPRSWVVIKSPLEISYDFLCLAIVWLQGLLFKGPALNELALFLLLEYMPYGFFAVEPLLSLLR